MPILVKNLMHNQPALVVTEPEMTLREALALMIEHDFSQLPVVKDDQVQGIVTSDSALRALLNLDAKVDGPRVEDAIVKAKCFGPDDDLFDLLGDLANAPAILIVGAQGKLVGIVTSYDATQFFRRRAEDIILVADIETTLKEHILAAFGASEGAEEQSPALQSGIATLTSSGNTARTKCRAALQHLCSLSGVAPDDAQLGAVVERHFPPESQSKPFDRLSLNEYIQLALQPEAWDNLSPIFRVMPASWRTMMEGLRDTRNSLAHFRGDITPLERDSLRFCADWFKNHRPLDPADAFGSNATLDVQVAAGAGTSSLLAQPPALNGLDLELREGQGQSDSGALDAGEQGSGVNEAVEEVDSDGGEDLGSAASKYAPLARFLAAQKSHERVVLPFAEIERMIGAPLPVAAREHRSWWANDPATHVQSEQWLEVNWRVVSINMTTEKVTFARARDRERAYIDFFSGVQNALRECPSFPLAQANPLGNNWILLANLPGDGQRLILSFAHRQRLRLEFYIDTGDGDENNRLFDALQVHRALLNDAIGSSLAWERLEKRRASRLALYTQGSINGDQQKLKALEQWAVDNSPRFYSAIEKLTQEVLSPA